VRHGEFLSRGFLSLILLVAWVTSLSGQEWARKMFEKTSYDFGNVARGSQAEFAFQLTNSYVEDVHIASVESNCGCTSSKPSTPTLKTWDQGQILCRLNTRHYTGQKDVTVTVQIDQPYPAEVQLRLKANIRSDVMFQPGLVKFGAVDFGNVAEQTITVDYTGQKDWRIVDVRSANEHFQVELDELLRGRDRVRYQLLVRLTDDAPVGYINDQLSLVTADERQNAITLPVQGRVVSPLTVSPPSLLLGVLEQGEEVTKQLVVRAKKPFRIVRLECKDTCFDLPQVTGSKKLHIVPVKFIADRTPGKVVGRISIETDNGVTASCIATATIKNKTQD